MEKSYKVTYYANKYEMRQDIFDNLPDSAEETITEAIAKMFDGWWGFSRDDIKIIEIIPGHYGSRTRPRFPFATTKTFVAD